MLLAAYASDSDSGSDTEASAPRTSTAPVTKPALPATTKSTAPAAPTASAAGSAPKGKKRTGPIKITLDLPKAGKSKGKGSGSDNEDGGQGESDTEGAEKSDGEGGEDRGAKRVKLGGKGLKGGAGASSLLGMLPAPKRKLPATASGKATLGGGSGDKKSSLSVNTASSRMSSKPQSTGSLATGVENEEDEQDNDTPKAGPSSLLPASMARKAAKAGAAKKQEEELDLFGLGNASTANPAPAKSTPLLPPSSSISSAPAVTDFVPPEPTPNDPYPGYYQLPSGQWAAYEPEYYHSFFPDAISAASREAETKRGNKGDGRTGHAWADFRDREGDMVDVHASEGLAEAREEEERRQMRAKPKMAGDDFVYQAVGATKGVAADRHQLSSLLNSAYNQREALEERIAANKKSSRTGRAKYGF